MISSEWLTGNSGLRFFFGYGRMKLNQKDLKDAENIEKYLEKRAKQWVALKRPTQPPKPKYKTQDFDQIIASLDNPLDANPDISQVPEELQVDFVAKYLDVRAWLEEHQPAIKFSGGLIAQELPPSNSDKCKFLWSVNVLDDIGRVFDLLDAGCIAPSEAMALRDVYPEFTMSLMISYLNETVDFLYKNPYKSLSGWQMSGLSALAGVPITSFADVMSWQMNYDSSSESGGKAPDFAKSQASDMQTLSASV